MRATIFPGQGSQKVGMGLDLYENSPAARVLFEKANKDLGLPLTDVMFANRDDLLKETLYTQLAIFVHSFVVYTLVDGYFPMAAGHSVGQYTALAAFDAMSYEDTLKVVHARASAMNEAAKQNPGTMRAVLGLDALAVKQICDGLQHLGKVVAVANYNCPGQIVISGTVEAVDEAERIALRLGARRVLKFPVSGAWHSPLMEPARAPLMRAFRDVEIKSPSGLVYDNISAQPVSEPGKWVHLLERHIVSPVYWEESVEKMIRQGATSFVEMGPGNVLAGLIQRINPHATVRSIGTWEEVQAYNQGR